MIQNRIGLFIILTAFFLSACSQNKTESSALKAKAPAQLPVEVQTAPAFNGRLQKFIHTEEKRDRMQVARLDNKIKNKRFCLHGKSNFLNAVFYIRILHPVSWIPSLRKNYYFSLALWKARYYIAVNVFILSLIRCIRQRIRNIF